MTLAKLFQLAALWGLAWLLSLGLVQAGRHWPEPLVPQPPLIWALLLTPALLMVLLLIWRWPLRQELREGESSREAQSPQSSPLPEQEQSP